MKFEDMFKIQKEFEELISETKYGKQIKDLNLNERIEFLKELILGLYNELAELQLEFVEFPTKLSEFLVSNMKEEAIDVLKYTLGILSLIFQDSEEIERIFEAKSKYILTKYKSVQSLKRGVLENKKVVIIDIDGVLYPYEEIKNKILSNSLSYYYKNKFKYRVSGIKADYPPYDYAKEFLEYLRSKEYFILILTSRPVWKISKIALDTYSWFEKYKLHYDAIFFERDKFEFIAKYIPDFYAIIEDDANFLKKLSQFDVKGKLILVSSNPISTNEKIHVISRDKFLEKIKKIL